MKQLNKEIMRYRRNSNLVGKFLLWWVVCIIVIFTVKYLLF